MRQSKRRGEEAMAMMEEIDEERSIDSTKWVDG